MKDPLLPPHFPKNGIWGRQEGVSPPFSLFENGGATAGVNFPLKASSPKKKRFILEFQVLKYFYKNNEEFEKISRKKSDEPYY